MNKSHVYLGSYSKSIDKLPMWSQYGNDGKGCCLIIRNDFFDYVERDNFDINAIAGGTELIGKIQQEKGKEKLNEDSQDLEKYALHKVTYMENQKINCDDEEKQIKIISRIAEVLVALENYIINDIEDDGLKKEIDEFVMGTLDQVRFLYKDISYEHEKELRLVKFSETSYQDDNPNFIVPKLYIEINKPIEYKEIILGPKVEQPSIISPYIYSTKKVGKVTRSSIKYR